MVEIKLKGKIYEQGFTINDIAKAIGKTQVSVSYKLHGKVKWNSKEKEVLKKLLSIADEEEDLYFK